MTQAEAHRPVDAEPDARRAHLRAVGDYYFETWLDYRAAWTSPDVPGLHMGYWDETAHNHRESLQRTNEVLADRAGIGPGDVVLDAGCGVGGSMKYLERERGAACVGSTLSLFQAATANRLLGALDSGAQDRLTCSDFTQLPFGDDSFDVVWAMESLCHEADPARFLAEAHRVLRPGGRLAVWDGFRTGRAHGPADDRLLGEFLAGWAVDDLSTFDELERAVRQAGFEVVVVEDAHAAVRRSLRRLRRLAVAVALPARVLARLGIRSAAQERSRRSALLQWRCYRRRLWTLGIVVAVKPGGDER